MVELIERGHVYIAQPPLYKVKRGKQEHYVKDDAELNAYLLNVALENAELFVSPDAPPITGPGVTVRSYWRNVTSLVTLLAQASVMVFVQSGAITSHGGPE